jgi:hypothetical protein
MSEWDFLDSPAFLRRQHAFIEELDNLAVVIDSLYLRLHTLRDHVALGLPASKPAPAPPSFPDLPNRKPASGRKPRAKR